jgi:hypothetical protein
VSKTNVSKHEKTRPLPVYPGVDPEMRNIWDAAQSALLKCPSQEFADAVAVAAEENRKRLCSPQEQHAKNAELGMTCGNFLTALMNRGLPPASAARWLAHEQPALGYRIPILVAHEDPKGFLEVAKVIDSL